MSNPTPTVRQVSKAALVPQVAIVVAVFLAGRYLWGQLGVAVAAAVLLAYSYGSRRLIARHHRQGFSLVKQGRFREAIAYFEKSLAFFDAHPWVDRWKAFTMMSSSSASYREMALINIAYCHLQLGEGAAAREQYNLCLKRFPDSGLAQIALRMMDASAESTPVESSPDES